MQDETKQPEITLDDLDRSASTVKPTSSDVPVRLEDLNGRFIRFTEEDSDLKEQILELKSENTELKSIARTAEILNDLMKPSATKAFNYMFAYSGMVGAILLMNDFGCFQVPLDAEVLKFLVGSTAATVIGLVGMVLTGVFLGARK